MPSTDVPATTPTEKRLVYPWRRISGLAIFVNTAADAMEDPVIAAKIAFAATVAMPRPPLIRRSIQRATSKVSRPISETPTRSPIITNSGMTARTWFRRNSFAACMRVRSAITGRPRIRMMPTKPTTISATPICMPKPISATMKTTETRPIMAFDGPLCAKK